MIVIIIHLKNDKVMSRKKKVEKKCCMCYQSRYNNIQSEHY
jgi:hypothetical protein